MDKFLTRIAITLPMITMLIIMELMINEPQFFWQLFAFLIGIIFIAALYLSGFLQKKKLKQISYLTLPLFYAIGSISLFVLAQKSLAQHVFLVGVSLFMGLVLQNISALNRYRHNTDKEVLLKSAAERRKRIAITINQALIILTIFFLFSSLFGIIYLMSYPIWQALSIAALILLILTYQFFDELFPKLRALLYAAITSLSLIQIFWSLTFWPTNYIANSIVIIVTLYIILGIMEKYSYGLLTKRLIKVYFTIVLVAICAVLTTTQWTTQ